MEYLSIDNTEFCENELDLSKAIDSFHKLIIYYMDERSEKIGVEELAARTGISTRTINQMRSERESEHRFSLKYLVAVSIGLHMMTEHSFYLIHLNGQCLRKSKRNEKFYIYLLTECNHFCVAACNDFLRANKLSPLTTAEIFSYN